VSGQRWTDEEKRILKASYKTVPTRELATQLGRSARAIYARMAVDGLATPRIRFDGWKLELIRQRNADGLSDSDIAAELGADRHCITAQRKRLGLPSNACHARQRDKIRVCTKRQCDRAGVSSVGELRAVVYRARAIKAGWPSDLRWRSVQILELLEQRGPMTRKQIAEAIGLPWRGSRKSLRSNDPEGSYLANLMRRGLVIRLGRIVRGEGRCKNVYLYAMALNAERNAAE
jgi:hypothetical protein